METGKTGKYLKYAIGEIILVVIGILIALQINNWNETKKLIQKEQVIIESLILELGDIKLELNTTTSRNSVYYNLNTKIVDSIKKNHVQFKETDLASALNYRAYTIRNPVLKDILGSDSKLPTVRESLLRQLRALDKTLEEANKFEYYLDALWNDKTTAFFITSGISFDGTRPENELVTLDELALAGYSIRQLISILDISRDLLKSWTEKQNLASEQTLTILKELQNIKEK
jgi:hypothetical protein